MTSTSSPSFEERAQQDETIFPATLSSSPPSNRGAISTLGIEKAPSPIGGATPAPGDSSSFVTFSPTLHSLSLASALAERVLSEVSFDELKRGRRLQVSLHHLTATIWECDLETCLVFISEVLGHRPAVREYGHIGYTRTFVWVGGLKVMVNGERADMGVCLLAEGEACEFYGFKLLAYIYQSLQCVATHIDIAVDGCRFTPSSIFGIWLKGWVVTGVKRDPRAKPGRESYRKYTWQSSPDGDTLYLGSRRSSQYVRIYNRRGFNRFEIVLRQERAAQVMAALCAGKELAATTGSVISQFVRFAVPSGKNLSRARTLPFWKRFIESLTTNDVVTRLDSHPEPTLARFIERVETIYAPDLAVYEIIMGTRDGYDEVRRDLRRIGLESMKPRHKGLIEAGGGYLWEHDQPRFKLVREERPSLMEVNERLRRAA